MSLAGALVRLPFAVATNALAAATALPRLVVALERLGEARPALDRLPPRPRGGGPARRGGEARRALDRLADAASGLDQLAEVAPVLERLGLVLEDAREPLERLADA